jgi:hypothetical protein
MVTLHELTYSPEHGRDIAVPFQLAYSPSAFKTKEAAAKGFYEALKKFAIEKFGYSQENVESEIHLYDPERTAQYSGSNAWCVVWESGPYQWAIGVSMQMQGPWGYCEPHYSFDLHFTE